MAEATTLSRPPRRAPPSSAESSSRTTARAKSTSAPTAIAAQPSARAMPAPVVLDGADRVCAGPPVRGGPRGVDELGVKARGVQRPVALPPDGAGVRLEVEDRDVRAVEAAAPSVGEPAAQPGGVLRSRAGEHQRDVDVRRRRGVETCRELDGERRDRGVRLDRPEPFVEQQRERGEQDERRHELHDVEPASPDRLTARAPAAPR